MKESIFKSLIVGATILLLCICFMSCSRKINSTVQTVSSDSSVTKISIVPKDTVIQIPGEQVHISVPQDQITEVPLTTQNGRAHLSINRTGNQINATASCEAYEKLIQLQQTTIEKLSKLSKASSTIKEIPVRFVPKLYLWLSGFGVLSLIILTIYICIKIQIPKL